MSIYRRLRYTQLRTKGGEMNDEKVLTMDELLEYLAIPVVFTGLSLEEIQANLRGARQAG